MSVIFKAKLKNAKSAIADKNYDYAYDLCHDLLELDDKNYNVHILLGVSCQHMEKWDEGEKVYRAAMSMPKANLLAWQGLCALFENANMADKYRGALSEMRDKCMGEGNTAKAWEAMSKILKLSEDSGDQRSLIGVLRELAPAGKFNTLLEETGGEQTPPSAGEVLQRVFTIERDLEQKTIEREVNKRKTRLGAGPITKVRKDVRMEVWADSSMLDTLSQLISFYSDESSLEKRLEYEECYFEALLERAATYDNAQQKSSMGEEAQRVAWDLASNGRSQAAFEHLIELADSSNDDDNLRGLADGYLQMFPSGRLAKSAQLWVQLEDGETNDDAIEAAQQGRDAASDSPFAYVLLVRLAIRSKMFRLAADSGVASRSVLGGFCARYGVALPHSQLTIDLGVADAYMGLGLEDVSEAEKLYRRCLEADPGNARAVLGLGLSLCSLGNFEESKQLLETALETDPSNHLALGGLGRVLMAEGNVAVAVDYFIKAIAVSSNYADHHIYLGNAYWEMGGQHQEDKQYAYSSWISAAKIDPDTSQTFCGLGQWYQQFGHDESRAKKCFAKAFQLNNADSQAGQALAQIYLSEGSDDLCEAMLVKATDSQYNQKWAWKLLGFLRLRQDQSEQAIVAFRNALTVDRTDRLCWEGLCEAYMAIGRLDTCVKVARKVIELDPERLSGYWLGAKAAMAANEYREALGMFDRAIGRADQPDNEAAVAVWRRTLLISKAECLVMLAAQWHEEGFFGRVIDASNEALDALLLVVEGDGLAPREYVVWKTVCSACVWISRMRAVLSGRVDLERSEAVKRFIEVARAGEVELEVPEYLADVSAEANIAGNAGNVDEYVQQVFVLAEQAARQCILVATSTSLAATAWVDLAHVYYETNSPTHHVLLQRQAGALDPSTTALLVAAGKCAQAAQQLDPVSVPAYNMQGVVAAYTNQLSIAQHAFIVASRLAPGSAIPWVNLGFLYLHSDDVELANKAFSQAQIVDPEFLPAWLGQAVIAETLGYADSLQLFEHCLLSASVSKAVGDFGYAKQVWQAAVRKNAGDKASAQQQKQPVKAAGTQDHSLLSASEQNRLTLAIFAARRYVERSEDTGGAGHHLLGLLLEQNAEYEEAADAYAAALERVAETSNSRRAWIARVHLGRALCSAGRCDEAADVYDRATELQVPVEIDSQQAFYATLGHSLALFFAERLEQSLGMFEQTLEKSEAVPALRPVVAVMLAQVLWALGSDEHRALARQHLLEVMADHTGLLPGLATLFGIGLLQGDGDLIAATYPELQKLRDQDPAHDVARIESYVALLREDPAGGRRALSKAVYRNPSDAQLWVLLAQFELRCGHNAKAMCAADSAISLFGQATRGQFSWSSAPSQAVSNSATLGVVVDASVVKTASLEQGRVARSAARRAVMYQPWVETTWNALATTT